MTEPEELPEVPRVERLSLRPGDSLVLTVDHQINDQDYHQLRERMRELYPGVRILVLDGGVTLSVLEAAAE